MSAAASSTGGSAPASLASKLEVAGDIVFTVRHAPHGFAAVLGDIGEAVWQKSLFAPLDLVVAFHTTRAGLAEEWPSLVEAAEPVGLIWVAWPREGTRPTDLNEDKIRRIAAGWTDNKACSIDGTWDALRFAMQPKRLRPKDNAKRKR